MTRADAALPAGFAERALHLGRAELLQEGPDGVLFACGPMVAIGQAAAAMLAARGMRISVVNVHTIKPLDGDTVVALARATGVVVTAENHSIVGGIGTAVAETLMEADMGTDAAPGFARIGVRDTFAEGGSTPYLFKKYGLTAAAIVAAFERLGRSRGRR